MGSHLLHVLVAAVVLGSMACGDGLAPVRIWQVGCEVLHRSGRCERASEQVQLLVQTEQDVAISVFSGLRPLPPQVDAVERGLFVSLDGVDATRPLRVIAHRGLAYRSQLVPLSKLQTPDWLRAAKLQLKNNQGASLLPLLKGRLTQPLPAEQRAEVLEILGRIAKDEDRLEDARALLIDSMQQARAAGVISQEFDALMPLAMLYSERYQQLDRAEQLWREREELLQAMPELRPWALLALAIYRQKLGDLRGAQRYIDEGRAEAQRFASAVVLAELSAQQAKLLMRLGRVNEVESHFKVATETKVEPCRRAALLLDHALLRITLRAAERPELALSQQLDARPLLHEGLKLMHAQCAQNDLEAKLLTALAQAEAMAAEYEPALQHVAEARRLLKANAPELTPAWLEVEGRAALAGGHPELARERYQRMLEVARRLHGSEEVWRAMLGLAQATEPEDRAAAIKLYGQAEAYLDEASLSIPLEVGRGSYLGRFEFGTRLYVDLLHRDGQDAAAMNAVRHARARGMWALSLMQRIENLDAEKRRQWEAILSQYLSAHAEFDRLIADAGKLSLDQELALRQKTEQKSGQLLSALASAMRILGERPERPAFQAPGPGECVLTCHPVRRGWLCFAADQRGVRTQAIPQLNLHAGAAELAAQLLLPLADKLEQAQRLRIIAYGELRQLDFHALPFHGEPLGLRREVVYSLDVPWLRPEEDALAMKAGRAMLLFDTDDSLPSIRRSAQPIREAMQAAGWQLDVRIGSESAHDALLEQLRAVGLFHYAGHADFTETGVWSSSLRTSDAGRLLIADILLLDRVPRAVSLFACNSGRSSEQLGGLEGLGPAQAFLLRGSRYVLGTVRPIHEQLAALVSVEFYRRLFQEGRAQPPYTALRAALQAAARQLPPGTRANSGALNSQTPEQDLDAFRIFVH